MAKKSKTISSSDTLPSLDPELTMLNNEIGKIVAQSLQQQLSEDDLRRLESLIKMRSLLQEKPAVVYIKDSSEIYDRTILSAIKLKKPKRKYEKKDKKHENNDLVNKNDGIE